jgi:hypothetical protein
MASQAMMPVGHLSSTLAVMTTQQVTTMVHGGAVSQSMGLK